MKFSTIVQASFLINPFYLGKMSFKKSRGSEIEKPLSLEEEQAKINEIRKLIGPIADKLPALCSDASISSYLRARNWSTKKACKMLKESLKWRLEYKPEKIHWDNIAQEAETGKIYRANYLDNHGRVVLVMRPGFQNSASIIGQIKYLVYCMEKAIMTLGPGVEQIVWLIDFQSWTMSSVSVKVTRETAHVLQNHYPERLGLAILYNPPKIFESFWKVVKPFMEHKTYKKVLFVYLDNPESKKIMEKLFDIDKLESAFGGQNSIGFDYKKYSESMKEEDKKMSDFIDSGCSSSTLPAEPSIVSFLQQSESLTSDNSDGVPSSSDEGGSPNFADADISEDEKIRSEVGCKDSVKGHNRY